MNSTLPNRMDVQQAHAFGQLLNRAFHNDPMYSYILPDSTARAQRLPRFFASLLRAGHLDGEVYGATGAHGVALWLPPGQSSFGQGTLLRSGMALNLIRLGTTPMRRFLGFINGFEEVHQELVKEPHWFLLILGVDPAHQGKGVGKSLVQSTLDRADQDGKLTYLETHEGNLRFYQALGFSVVHEGRVSPDAPPFIAMQRQPQK